MSLIQFSLATHPLPLSQRLIIFLCIFTTATLRCFSYLLMLNKLPPNIVASNNEYLLHHSFCETRIWAWLTWVLFLRVSYKATIKVLVRTMVSYEGSTGSGSTGKLTDMPLVGFNLTQAHGLRTSVPQWLTHRPPSICCSVDLRRYLTTWQLVSIKARKRAIENMQERNQSLFAI